MILIGLFLLFHHEVIRAENPFQILTQKYKEILLVFLSGVLGYFISYILKFLFHTPRPFEILNGVNALFIESSYAFPSGHSVVFMALAFAIFFIHKKVGYIFILFAFLIGLVRIIAGVHFPIDILGGFILGFLIAFFVKYFYVEYFQIKTYNTFIFKQLFFLMFF